MPTRPQTIDPLAVFLDRAVAERGRPIPLVATDFTVRVAAGLAIVETQRRFRNTETGSIEATMTFPVPIHATLYGMEAKIDGRVLRAVATRRTAARETYETALDDGKAAVLHEEVLRGVHMLSVGHVPPGGEIEVTTRWAACLAVVEGMGRLRIPLTVGDIYGRSPLPDSDDLVHAPVTLTGSIAVHGDGVLLNGRPAPQERAPVRMNAPLDLTVREWPARTLSGRAADGAAIELAVRSLPPATGHIAAAVLVDRSGSMNEASGRAGETRHAAAVRGLLAAADDLAEGDAVSLFTFDDACEEIGGTDAGGRVLPLFGPKPVAARFRELVARLGPPRGGTEIGRAIAAVQRARPGADILLVTDGKSHALDVQTLARSGHRISAVLVGVDSLEANVGHLAALTGGDMFVAGTDDLPATIRAALASLRTPSGLTRTVRGAVTAIELRRSGALIEARIDRTNGGAAPSGDGEARAVAAIAAALELAALPEEAAAALAEAEGLVTHLTSLVVVDEAASAQPGVPSTRKVPLPSPVLSQALASGMPSLVGLIPVACRARPGLQEGRFAMADLVDSGAAAAIEWAAFARELAAADLTGLPADQAARIEQLASEPEVAAFAARHGLDPIAVAVGLLALADARRHRAAARIGKALLGHIDAREAVELAETLGLDTIDASP